MVQQNFSAQVDEWVRKSERRMEAVFKESAQRVIADMQTPVGAGGNMPVDTGALRASLQATLDAPNEAVTSKEGAPTAYSEGQVALVIASANLGQTVFATYSMNYARPVEYGSRGRAGRGFVRLAAQKWRAIVNQVVAEAKARFP